MKRISTLIVALIATVLTVNAQGPHAAMTFAGKSYYYVTMMSSKTAETHVASDSIIYAGSNFILPSMSYNDLTIPSFTITGTNFTGGYGGVTWEDQTFTSTVTDATGAEKTITGSSLKGAFTHDGDIYKLVLEVTFTYGSMPFPLTYSIEGYYVKEYAGENQVTVGGQFGPYKATITQKVRTYVEDEVTKMDVEIPTYELDNTAIGNLTLGTYTVKGLTYDEGKGGYYKDYAADGLTMHFIAEQGGQTTFDGDYALAAAGQENILVQIVDKNAIITNNFKAGNMPFPIVAIMDQTLPTGIDTVKRSDSRGQGFEDGGLGETYNLQGQRVNAATRGIVVRNGKKYVIR